MAAARKIGFLAALLQASIALASEPLVIRVLGDRVNLRAQPIENAEVIGQMMSGDMLISPDPLSSNAWMRVVAPQSIDLWVYGELIKAGHVVVNKAQVRGGPGLQFKRVGELSKDTAVVVRGELGDWVRIAPTEECFLWISRDYIAPVLPEVADVTPEPDPLPAVSPSSSVAESALSATAAVPPAVPEPLPDGIALTQPASIAEPATETSVSGVTPAPETRTVFTLPPPLPLALNGYIADAHRPQNARARFSGTLARVNVATGPRYSHYQIVMGTERNQREVLCRLIGLPGQLDALIDSPVEVQGRIWHLAGQDIPVLDAQRLLRLVPRP